MDNFFNKDLAAQVKKIKKKIKNILFLVLFNFVINQDPNKTKNNRNKDPITDISMQAISSKTHEGKSHNN